MGPETLRVANGLKTGPEISKTGPEIFTVLKIAHNLHGGDRGVLSQTAKEKMV